ncbi:MAG: SH3 domain-containing protein [Leptospiraceae bacterium]|nr:SH3 domain-containing protein [Leptospiraceae bacterium]MCP5513809.1 SH3 domain-containing protein [Leptospiraceae bacterium]
MRFILLCSAFLLFMTNCKQSKSETDKIDVKVKFENPTYTYYITNQAGAPIFLKPQENQAIFKTIPFGSPISYIGKSNHSLMSEIEIEGKVYYVLGKDVDKNPPYIALKYVSSKDGLIFRSKPDKSSSKIDLIPFREEVMVISNTNKKFTVGSVTGEWLEIVYKNKKGFVFDGFLEDYPPEEVEEDSKKCEIVLNNQPENVKSWMLESDVFRVYLDSLGNVSGNVRYYNGDAEGSSQVSGTWLSVGTHVVSIEVTMKSDERVECYQECEINNYSKGYEYCENECRNSEDREPKIYPFSATFDTSDPDHVSVQGDYPYNSASIYKCTKL